jgi:WD40 repeat protein/serine/threonine protein kinase
LSDPGLIHCCIVCGEGFRPASVDAAICPGCSREQGVKPAYECSKDSGTLIDQPEEKPALPESAGESAPGWRAGEVVLDLYEIKDIFTSGGMGLVYRARHRSWNIDLVIKSPRSEIVARAGGSKAFIREAETWMDLGLHPHIVTCHYVRTIQGLPRVFAEFVDGGSLKDWIDDGRLYEGSPEKALARVIDISIQFARGLGYAHVQNLVHRDVKPANVLLTTRGTAKVTDFGLAKARPDEVDATDTRGRERQATSAMMTPAYCSPEQAERAALAQAGVDSEQWPDLSRATDTWSWAVSVLHMFTGDLTWPSGLAAPYVLDDYLRDGPPQPHLPPMPKELAALLKRCFEDDPASRPQEMSSLAADLIALYEKVSGSKYPRPEPEPADLRADALNNRALSLLDLGRAGEAEAFFVQALDLDRHHLAAIYNRGLYRWRSGLIHDVDVLFELEPVKKDRPEDAGVQAALGWVRLEGGYFTEARAHFERALELGDDGDARRGLELARQPAEAGAGQCFRTLEEHTQEVTSVDISPDDRYAVSGSHDHTLKLWDLSTGKCIRTFKGHESHVNTVNFSPDGRYLLSGSLDKTVKLWDADTGRCLRTFKGHNSWVRSAAFSPDGRFAISAGGEKDYPYINYKIDYTLRLWDLFTGECLRAFEGHTEQINSVAVSPDSSYVLSGSEDKTLRLWDFSTGEFLHTFEGHSKQANSVVFSPNGGFVLTGSDDKTVKLWDVSTGRCLRTFGEHKSSVTSVTFFPDGRSALSGSADKTLKLWEVSTGRCLRTFEGHTERVNSVALSSGGRFALSGSGFAHLGRDNTLKIWEISSILANRRDAPFLYSMAVAAEEAVERERSYSFYLDRTRKAVESGDITEALDCLKRARAVPGFEKGRECLELYMQAAAHARVKTFKDRWLRYTLEGHAGEVKSAVFSPDGCHVLSGSRDKTLRQWEVVSGKCLRIFQGHEGHVDSVAFSPDGRFVLSGGSYTVKTRNLRLWEASTGRCLHTLIWVSSALFSPDGCFALSMGSRDKRFKLWKVSTWECLCTFSGHDSTVNAAAYSPCGCHVLSGSVDKTLKLWGAADGECLRTFEGHQKSVESVAFSPDGRQALSGSSDRMLRLWDLSTGECLRIFEGHVGSVNSVSFSPDGRHALSGSDDQMLKLWELSTGKCLCNFEGHKGSVNSAVFSPDGYFVLSGSNDKTLKLWVLDWVYDFPGWAGWDDGAEPYLKNFLILRKGKWGEEDFKVLITELSRRGYGWLKPAGVRRKLKELTAQRG